MRSIIVWIFILITESVGINITIFGSSHYVVPGRPFTFKCVFSASGYQHSSVELLQNGEQLEAVQLSNAGSGVCYNITKAATICDPSRCFCSQQGDNFTAKRTIQSIDTEYTWSCKEFNNQSPLLNLKVAVLVTSVTLDELHGSQIDVIAGKSISLTRVTGQTRPRSYIQWYIGNDNYTINSTSTVTNGQDELTSVTSVLTFSPKRDQTNLAVHCKAYNVDPSTRVELVNKPKLNIQYMPKLIALHPKDIVNETRNLGPIICSADCNPGCSYTWTGPELSSITGATLHITGIKKEQAGNYLCTASNSLGRNTSENVVIEVNYKQKYVFLQPQKLLYTANENQPIGPIQCYADCNPNCSFLWTGPESWALNGPQLHINSIKKTQAGNYTCTARKIVGNKTSEIVVVIVTYSPKVISLNPPNVSYTLIEVNTLGPIHCNADCFPECTYTWSGPVTISGNSLTIAEIWRKQEGHYKCTATNSVGSLTSSEINVTVNYGPDDSLILDPPSLNYVVNETYQLGPIECRATCKPSCAYKWIIPRQNDILGNNITILSIQRSDTGLYKCIAYNGITNGSSKVINVIVHCYPRTINITNNDRHIAYGLGEKLSITIVYLAYPKPTFQWYFKSIMVSKLSKLTNGSENVEINNLFEYQSDVFRHVSHITIKALQEEYFGSYLIYSSNEVNVTLDNFVVAAKEESKSDSKNVLGLEIGLSIGSLAVMFVLVPSVIFIIRRMTNTSSEGAYENALAVKEHEQRDYYNLEVGNDTIIYNVPELEDAYENGEKNERYQSNYESLQKPNDEQAYEQIKLQDKTTITTADRNVYVNTAIR